MLTDDERQKLLDRIDSLNKRLSEYAWTDEARERFAREIEECRVKLASDTNRRC